MSNHNGAVRDQNGSIWTTKSPKESEFDHFSSIDQFLDPKLVHFDVKNIKIGQEMPKLELIVVLQPVI